MSSSNKKFVDLALLIACNLIWASQFVLVKLVQQEVGPIFATALPMLFATLLLVPFVWPLIKARLREPASRAASHGLTRGDVMGFAIIGVLGQVAAQLLVTWGVRYTQASNAALISLALPVATAVIAFVLLRERMSVVRWIGFALAMAGVVLCSLNDIRNVDTGAGSLKGNVLVLGGILGSAFYNVYSKKLLAKFDALEVLFGSYVFVCLFLPPLALVLEPASFAAIGSLSVKAWVGLGLLGMFQYFLSMVIFLTVLARLDATQAALSNYLIPFFGVVLAWLILGERLTSAMLAGGALVLGSTLLVTLVEHRASENKGART
ncbi:MAG: DMT family transporter [Deltaproteobacteria bacterium]|nr:DMT family transporter [Deltaproteobacteria bacterium]